MSTRRVARPGVSRGSELLAAWIGERPRWSAAIDLKVDIAAVSAFITGQRKPGASRAEQIDRQTKGFVPAACWDEPASEGFRLTAKKARAKRMKAKAS